jgi:hypothetical protein
MMEEKTEKEKMMAGELYLASDPELASDRLRARRLTVDYNATFEGEANRRPAPAGAYWQPGAWRRDRAAVLL